MPGQHFSFVYPNMNRSAPQLFDQVGSGLNHSGSTILPKLQGIQNLRLRISISLSFSSNDPDLFGNVLDLKSSIADPDPELFDP